MSNYGNPPSDPYGQNPQDPTGSSPQEPYGQPTQNPYGDQYAQGGYGAPQHAQFAHWGKRVGAYLIDGLILAAAMLPYYIGAGMAAGGATTEIDPITGQPTTTMGETSGLGLALMGLGFVLYLAVFIWNICIKQGKTGYSVGKGVMGIKLVKAETGQPIGAGMSFVRQLAHIIDAIPCYIGFLWPLWDAKRQTFADKIIGTYVIDQPKG
ncbi:RDD family protein [Nocardioides sp.]|uniref:RDD family protein n=1 Tax=Nocardioides sp. TaxID=35761 RepID=UPI00260E2A02|nr:RDD family protein [Nocardioides sp.]